MIVVKFGGTSVGDAAAIERAADIVAARLARRPVVVVSALSGVTNALLAIAEQATRGQLIGAIRGVEALRERHLEQADLLLRGPVGGEVAAELSATFDELASLAEALSVLGHLTPRSLDAIGAVGEQLSSALVVPAFKARGIDAELVDARDVMITDEQFTAATPQPERIAEECRDRLLPLLREGRVPVMGGFIGSTVAGVTTTLGRGGSDYSASLVGAALQAEAIEIWTDVDGMLTADPRVVEGARLIERIRFDEASELAAFGAKVLHPNTIAPAVRLGIPVYVYNSRKPEGTGTLITFEAPRRPVSAIAGRGGTTLVTVGSPRMVFAHGMLNEVLRALERHRTSVNVVATSEVSVSMTVDDPQRLDALIVDLRQVGDVAVARDRGILAIVGAGISDSTAAMARALSALDGLHLHMLSLSSTGINLTLVIDGAEVPSAMRKLHAAFFPAGAA